MSRTYSKTSFTVNNNVNVILYMRGQRDRKVNTEEIA